MSLRTWIDDHAVSFGGVSFMVLSGGQWATAATTVIRRVPGGNRFWVQFLGEGPETAVYTLKFASIDEFQAFKRLQGTAGILTLQADVAAVGARNPALIAGVPYDRLGDVVLTTIDSASVQYQNGGTVTCQATFVREVV